MTRIGTMAPQSLRFGATPTRSAHEKIIMAQLTAAAMQSPYAAGAGSDRSATAVRAVSFAEDAFSRLQSKGYV